MVDYLRSTESDMVRFLGFDVGTRAGEWAAVNFSDLDGDYEFRLQHSVAPFFGWPGHFRYNFKYTKLMLNVINY